VNINYFWTIDVIKDQFQYFDWGACPKKNMNVYMKLVYIRC
jgi:hypothetical protein